MLRAISLVLSCSDKKEWGELPEAASQRKTRNYF
jgi:hypothetical protein